MVKCADCGYLGVRHPGTHELVGPDERQRQTGEPSSKADSHLWSIAMGEPPINEIVLDPAPVCARGAFNLWSEWKGHVTNGKSALFPAAKEVMRKDRKCRRFVKTIPGLGPKERVNMDLLGWDRWFHAGVAIIAVVIGTLLGAFLNNSSKSTVTYVYSQPPVVMAPTNPK